MSIWHDAYAFNGPCGEMEFDEGYKEKPMLEQFCKVIDSEGVKDVVKKHKYKPVNSVITDDGYKVRITPAIARKLRDAVINVPTKNRLAVLKAIQNKAGLVKAIELAKAN